MLEDLTRRVDPSRVLVRFNVVEGKLNNVDDLLKTISSLPAPDLGFAPGLVSLSDELMDFKVESARKLKALKSDFQWLRERADSATDFLLNINDEPQRAEASKAFATRCSLPVSTRGSCDAEERIYSARLVTLCGLQSMSELNGCLARIVGPQNKKGRFPSVLLHSDGCITKNIALAKCNVLCPAM